LAVFLLIANLTVGITLVTEVYLLTDNGLTVNLNLGIQCAKTSYVGAFWIWRVVGYFQSWSNHHFGMDFWWSLFVDTAVIE
jgi:hypothetical protein